MARFDVYPNPDGAGYLLDMQADILEELSTRVVVPLIPEQMVPKSEPRLNPVFDIAGERHMLVTHYISAVPRSVLKRPIAALSDEAEAITRATDFLMQGF